MIKLTDEQKDAVDCDGHALVVACPGSGKTRVLTARVAKGLAELTSSKRRVIAMTYTHRASDEIRSRLDDLEIDQSCLWTGTIHAFAGEWILRPYAPYHERLRRGFRIAEERETEVILDDLKTKHKIAPHETVVTRWNRTGQREAPPEHHELLSEYTALLVERRLLDFDDALLCAYEVLCTHPEAAETLAGVCALLCIDEVQDTQDLQYAILSAVVRAGNKSQCRLFCVGDPDQAIFESLGAIVMTADEIRSEFGLEELHTKALSDNYRSTQRIVDAYRMLRPGAPITARASYRDERGIITFDNQTVDLPDLVPVVARLIKDSVDSGVAPQDISVVAPLWLQVRSIARALVLALPNVAFDAPGLSPIHSQRDSICFKLARMLLTTPEPRSYRTRIRWANDILSELSSVYGLTVENGRTARSLLKMINGIPKTGVDGLAFVEAGIDQILLFCAANALRHAPLASDKKVFFERAQKRASEFDEEGKVDVAALVRFFRHPSGVVVQTCHGVKGEEFDTVIAFGLLRGYVPNWKDIFASPAVAADRESKLLYVVCSRAKRRLHLIAERGRKTQKKKLYETSHGLAQLKCQFD